MLKDLFVSAVNMYQFPGEGWDSDVEYQIERCLDAGKSYSFLLDIVHQAWKVA